MILKNNSKNYYNIKRNNKVIKLVIIFLVLIFFFYILKLLINNISNYFLKNSIAEVEQITSALINYSVTDDMLTSTLDKIDPIVLILTGILGPKLLNIGFDLIEPKGI